LAERRRLRVSGGRRLVGLESADEGGLPFGERVAVADHLDDKGHERRQDGDDVHWAREARQFRVVWTGRFGVWERARDRTEHVGVDEEVVAGLRRIKVEEEVCCKE
jgi:hypothetical protein